MKEIVTWKFGNKCRNIDPKFILSACKVNGKKMKTVIFNVFSILCRTSVASSGYRAQHLGWVNKVREHALRVFQGQYTYFFVAGVRSKTSMSKNCSVLWIKVTTNLSYYELHWTVKLVIMVVKFRNKPCSTVKKNSVVDLYRQYFSFC